MRRRNPVEDRVIETFEPEENGAYLTWEWSEGSVPYKAILFVQTKDTRPVGRQHPWPRPSGAERGAALVWIKKYMTKPGRRPDHPRAAVQLWRDVAFVELYVDLKTGAVSLVGDDPDNDLRELGMAWYFRVQQMAARVVELLG